MKKLIAILMVLAIVAGFAFADDASTGNAQLTVITTINPPEPTFKLSTTQVEDGLGGNAGATKHVITADALLTAPQEVTFTITQTKLSKSVKAYTFTATATDLLLVRYKDPNGNTVNNVSPTEHPAAADAKKFPINGGNAGVATVETFATADLTVDQATVTGADSASYVITYTGVTVDEDTNVGTFTCQWAANADAVPGEYEATVILTVSST